MNANVVMQVATTKQFGDMEIQVYENPAVDHTSAQDDFYMTREQIGTALGYKNPSISIGTIHKRNAARLDPLSGLINLITPGGKQQTYVYNMRGVMEICRYSTQPKANAFIDFCWDVIAALMRGETVSLNANLTELKRQERFARMTQALAEIHSKMEALEAARQQDRNALDNVLFVCKQLERKLISMGQPQKQPEQTATAAAKETHSTTYKGRSEWRTEIYKLGNSIARMTGLTLNAVLKQAYDYIGRNYGWYFKDERKAYVERVGYMGDVKNLSGMVLLQAPNIRCARENTAHWRVPVCPADGDAFCRSDHGDAKKQGRCCGPAFDREMRFYSPSPNSFSMASLSAPSALCCA